LEDYFSKNKHQNAPIEIQNDIQSCVICMSKHSNVELLPCTHKCVCSKCFENMNEQEEEICPICRIPILSFFYHPKIPNYVERVSTKKHSEEVQQTTKTELIKLANYVKLNPTILERLKEDTRKYFLFPKKNIE